MGKASGAGARGCSCEQSPEFTLPLGILSIEQKIQSIVRKIYHGDGVILTPMKNLKVSTGAGFIVALTGDIITMLGLPPVPAPEKIDIYESGRISGLF